VYELQERCSKRAEERFKKEYPSTIVSNKDGTLMVNYTNHYNRRLNKCFVVLTAISIPENKETKVMFGVSRDKTLWDINENKQYGAFSEFSKSGLVQCEVMEKHCNSESEWDALVKPYMED
jgi:hypothetical protein